MTLRWCCCYDHDDYIGSDPHRFASRKDGEVILYCMHCGTWFDEEDLERGLKWESM